MIRLLVCLALVCVPCSLFAQDENTGDKLIAVKVAIVESNGDLPLKDGANLSVGGLNELIANLKKQNTLEHYQFFNLASLEAQEAMVQFGQQEPVVTGWNSTLQGRVQNNYAQKHTGCVVKVNSHVRNDGKIMVELSLTSSRIKKPKQEKATDDSNDVPAEFSIPSTEILTFQNTVLLTPGVSTVVVAGGDDKQAKASRTYVVVAATAK